MKGSDRKAVRVNELPKYADFKYSIETRGPGVRIFIRDNPEGGYVAKAHYPTVYLHNPDMLFEIEQAFRTAQELGEALPDPKRLRRLLKLYDS